MQHESAACRRGEGRTADRKTCDQQQEERYETEMCWGGGGREASARPQPRGRGLPLTNTDLRQKITQPGTALTQPGTVGVKRRNLSSRREQADEGLDLGDKGVVDCCLRRLF